MDPCTVAVLFWGADGPNYLFDLSEYTFWPHSTWWRRNKMLSFDSEGNCSWSSDEKQVFLFCKMKSHQSLFFIDSIHKESSTPMEGDFDKNAACCVQGDRVGCGVDFKEDGQHVVYFTKNNNRVRNTKIFNWSILICVSHIFHCLLLQFGIIISHLWILSHLWIISHL